MGQEQRKLLSYPFPCSSHVTCGAELVALGAGAEEAARCVDALGIARAGARPQQTLVLQPAKTGFNSIEQKAQVVLVFKLGFGPHSNVQL